MTIEEKLEKLTERHEALTLSVELMVTENRARDEKWDSRIAKLLGTAEKLVGTVEQLAGIAANHEHRIERLEG